MNHNGKSNEVLVVSCSLDEADIEAQVSALREKLLANLNKMAINAKDLKPSDTHGIAAAKKEEMDRMARALGTRRDYTEGDAFNREKQEELKRKRAVDREERDRQRDRELDDASGYLHPDRHGGRGGAGGSASNATSRSNTPSNAGTAAATGGAPPLSSSSPSSFASSSLC